MAPWLAMQHFVARTVTDHGLDHALGDARLTDRGPRPRSSGRTSALRSPGVAALAAASCEHTHRQPRNAQRARPGATVDDALGLRLARGTGGEERRSRRLR